MFSIARKSVDLIRVVTKSKNKCTYISRSKETTNSLCKKAIPIVSITNWYCIDQGKSTSNSKYYSPVIKEIMQSEEDLKYGIEREAKTETVNQKKSWRNMKFALIAFGVTSGCIGTLLIRQLGQPSYTENGTVVQDEFSHLPVWKQYIYRANSELDYFRRLLKEPSRDKLLPDVVQYPYYQPPYTLVLELTDVLVHPDWTYKTGWRFKKRPGIDQFLESLSGFYEIVIYTAEQGMTVLPIVNALDPNGYIMFKLMRDTTHFVDGHHVKDLDKLNRDLSKVIVVDWNGDSVKFHPDNCFKLERWKGNDDDTTLIDLTAFLTTIAQSEVVDVRSVVKHYNQFGNPLEVFREKQRECIEMLEEEERMKKETEPSVLKRWTPSFLR